MLNCGDGFNSNIITLDSEAQKTELEHRIREEIRKERSPKKSPTATTRLSDASQLKGTSLSPDFS